MSVAKAQRPDVLDCPQIGPSSPASQDKGLEVSLYSYIPSLRKQLSRTTPYRKIDPFMVAPRRFFPLLFEDGALAPRLRLLRLAGKLLVPSYRFKWPQLEWWQNRQFTQFLARFDELSVLNTDKKWM